MSSFLMTFLKGLKQPQISDPYKIGFMVWSNTWRQFLIFGLGDRKSLRSLCIAFKALLYSSFWAKEKIPESQKVTPRYLYCETQPIFMSLNKKCWVICLPALLKISTLVLSVFIFKHQSLQYSFSLLSFCWSPCAEEDKRIISSAYIRQWTGRVLTKIGSGTSWR